MGEPDAALGIYMNNPDRIRSVLEYYLGERLPQDWEYKELRGLYSVRNSKGGLTHRQRDLIGEVHAWGKDFLLGLENQEKINLTFPWRLMELDCLAYRRELEMISEGNQSLKRHYEDGDDFLYRFGKDDRVKPVLNLLLYWGKKKWEGPLSLRELAGDLSDLPVKMRRLSGDYKVHIISMRQIPEKAVQRMDSDLRYVLGIMRRERMPGEYAAYIRENREFFSRIPRSALDVIDACTDIKDFRQYLRPDRKKENGREETDMCYALEQIQKNAKKQGVKEGAKQGVRQGRQQISKLFAKLIADGRLEELSRAATDEPFQKELLKEYCI